MSARLLKAQLYKDILDSSGCPDVGLSGAVVVVLPFSVNVPGAILPSRPGPPTTSFLQDVQGWNAV